MASARAMKLLQRLRQSKAGAKPEDIKALYLAFGFLVEPGTRHDRATHPDFPELFGSIPRHKKLAIYVVDQAIDLVEKVISLEQAKENHDDQ